VKIVDLFPKQKRVVGFNPNTGKRTAFALKKTGVWQEMMDDIYGCETQFQLMRCRLLWAVKVVDDLWSDEWISLANEEFDLAVKALAAQQAE
jgi:hypothetical protein